MKKHISILLVIAIILSALYIAPVYADSNDADIQTKIDELWNMFGNSYFTVDRSTGCGKKSSGHYCDNCYTPNIVATSWFKNLFGNVSANQFPYTYYKNGEQHGRAGWSCFGFASFAEWYIFKSSNSSTVNTNYVETYKFNYANVSAYAKKGDLIRLHNGGDGGHSVIMIDADSTGMQVIHSNWSGTYNCQVRKDTVKYDGSNYDYEYFSISRATNRNVTTDTQPPINYVICNTKDATDITATSAIFNGTFTNPANAKIIKRGYQWGTSSDMCNYTEFDCSITWEDGLSHRMSNLLPDTTYYYKLIVKGEDGTYIYGNTKTFKTLPLEDTEKPSITNLKARFIEDNSFVIECDLYDNIGIEYVWFVVYSPLKEYQFSTVATNGNFKYTFNASDYDGTGIYSVHIYAFDAADNSSGMYSTGSFGPEYYIDFISNGGTGYITQITKSYDASAVLPNNIPAKENYKFLNWNTKADGSGVSYNPGDIYTKNENLTLYAQWEKIQSGSEPYITSTVTKSGNNYSVEVIPQNTEYDSEIIVASYSGNNLIGFEKNKYTGENLDFIVSKNTDKVKVMAWGSMSEMNSICKAVVISKSEFLAE